VIERRGTGGGLFRRLYHAFLVESGAPAAAAEACARAACAWTELAGRLRAAASGGGFAAAAETAHDLVGLETELAGRLREA
jgi:hypothetical protein